MREKHCWLAGGWRLMLERCERKTLLSWRLVELPNTVNVAGHRDEGEESQWYWSIAGGENQVEE